MGKYALAGIKNRECYNMYPTRESVVTKIQSPKFQGNWDKSDNNSLEIYNIIVEIMRDDAMLRRVVKDPYFQNCKSYTFIDNKTGIDKFKDSNDYPIHILLSKESLTYKQISFEINRTIELILCVQDIDYKVNTGDYYELFNAVLAIILTLLKKYNYEIIFDEYFYTDNQNKEINENGFLM
jgi:hypothetical protein